MENNFKNINLKSELTNALLNLDIENLTEIQEEAIPKILNGENVVAQSQTGTGKTLAYLLPLINKIDVNEKNTGIIILAPTHELVAQINEVILSIIKESGLNITSLSLIGSGNINRQIEKLKKKPNIIVGSCGRVLELINKKKISAHTVWSLVLDEGDKLFDKNSIDTLKSILKATKKDTQKLIFSATLNNKTIDIAKDLFKECTVIKIKEENTVNKDIMHGYFLADRRETIDTLRKILYAEKNCKVIAFISDGYNVDLALSKLRFHKVAAEAIYGDAPKLERQNALRRFKSGESNVLLATDVAARGLDVKGVTHVINLSMPKDDKIYLHRAGRAGRAGEIGTCYSILDPRDKKKIFDLQKKLKINIPLKHVYKGQIFED